MLKLLTQIDDQVLDCSLGRLVDTVFVELKYLGDEQAFVRDRGCVECLGCAGDECLRDLIADLLANL